MSRGEHAQCSGWTCPRFRRECFKLTPGLVLITFSFLQDLIKIYILQCSQVASRAEWAEKLTSKMKETQTNQAAFDRVRAEEHHAWVSLKSDMRFDQEALEEERKNLRKVALILGCLACGGQPQVSQHSLAWEVCVITRAKL